MGLVKSHEGKVGKEEWKWDHYSDETHPNDPTVHGMKAREHREYPAVMSKVLKKNPWEWEEIVVHTPAERANQETLGFVWGGRGPACDRYEEYQKDIAEAAAFRNYEDRNLGEKARAQSDAFEQSKARHQGEIPRTPIKKRGRPAKTEAVPA